MSQFKQKINNYIY